jgi:pimeloyl-ACP methyl ester carboxylesterase
LSSILFFEGQGKSEGDMPYASNAGVKIHYEVEGNGPVLVLQHGFTQSLEDWAECGYVAPLRPKYRMILIDARGHGGSDKPSDEASYTLDRRVADVTAVLDAEGIERAHFWGYSMGGWIGFGMAKYVPQRVNGLIIGGQHPFARDQSGFRQWLREGVTGGPDVLVSSFERMVGPISDSYRAKLREGKLEAWLAASADRVSIEDVLETMTMPSLLYAGDKDPLFAQASSAAKRIPGARFFALPGLSHIQAFVESNGVVPKVMDFLGAI